MSAAATVGALTHRPLDLRTDLLLLHGWVTHPRAVYWMMQDASIEEVRREYAGILASPHHAAYVGLHDGRPAFLMETYAPAHDPVGEHLDVRPGDLGMHLLVAPPSPVDGPVPGFTLAVMRHVMSACFADLGVCRVVVEPDAANTPIHRLNRAVGFVEHEVVRLPAKDALLSTCTRADFERTLT